MKLFGITKRLFRWIHKDADDNPDEGWPFGLSILIPWFAAWTSLFWIIPNDEAKGPLIMVGLLGAILGCVVQGAVVSAFGYNFMNWIWSLGGVGTLVADVLIAPLLISKKLKNTFSVWNKIQLERASFQRMLLTARRLARNGIDVKKIEPHPHHTSIITEDDVPLLVAEIFRDQLQRTVPMEIRNNVTNVQETFKTLYLKIDDAGTKAYCIARYTLHESTTNAHGATKDSVLGRAFGFSFSVNAVTGAIDVQHKGSVGAEEISRQALERLWDQMQGGLGFAEYEYYFDPLKDRMRSWEQDSPILLSEGTGGENGAASHLETD